MRSRPFGALNWCAALVVAAGCASENPQNTPPPEGVALFEFKPAQTWIAPIPEPAEVRVADFDADGRADLAFNFKDGSTNTMYYAFSSAADTFVVVGASTHGTAVGEGWELYKTLVGVFNADALWDLGWNYTGTRNKTWYGLSDGVGNVDFAPLMERVEGGWSGFTTLVLDVNGDGIDDVVWNETTSQTNRVFLGLTDVFGFLEMRPLQSFGDADWSGFRVTSGDVNGDGREDLIWNHVSSSANRIVVATGRADGRFDVGVETDREGIAVEDVELLLGDVDADGRDDLVWVTALGSAGSGVSVSLQRADGSFEHRAEQNVPTPCSVDCVVRIGDFDGDGHADLVWNARGAANLVRIARGDASPGFDATPLVQQGPAPPGGEMAELVVGDVDGDGADDLIWVQAQASTAVLVGSVRTPTRIHSAAPREAP